MSSEAEEESVSEPEAEDSSPECKAVVPKTKKSRGKARKPRIIVNVLNTEYDVVKEVMRDFKYRISMEPEGEWDLFWADTGVTTDMLCRMKKYQKINHYPSMGCLARKNNLGKNLMRMRKEFPKDYSFFPPTWLLPYEWKEFKAQFTQKKCKTFIVKPEALSQGKGIFLTRSCECVSPIEHYVVQRYIHNPYLMDGLKFDLRIYVLVYGCDPLRIYIYKEGLARLATEPYVPPLSSNLGNMFMHLTNYAINKNSENFVFNTDAEHADVGNKRSLTFVWKYIDEHGGNSKELRARIQDSIVKTFCAVQPQLADSYKSCQPNDDRNDKCYEILGFDILLDHKLKPWLLEVNHSPSFTTDTPFDEKTKFELISDTIRLTNMDPMKRVKFCKQKEIESQNRRLGKTKGKPQVPKLTKEEHAEKRRRHMEKRDKYEMEHCGGYERIYPDPVDPNKYSNYIETARKIWDEFFVAKRKPRKDSPEPPKPKSKPILRRPPVRRPTLESPPQPLRNPPATTNLTAATSPVQPPSQSQSSAGNRTTVIQRSAMMPSSETTSCNSKQTTTDAPEKERNPAAAEPAAPIRHSVPAQSEQPSPPARALQYQSADTKYFAATNRYPPSVAAPGGIDKSASAKPERDVNVYFPLISKLPPAFQKMRSKGTLLLR